ncbi:MAG TPA: class I SAM-dependent methyltransferase [Acidimicrobiales bacterium]|nr:class I SAM-dependent methyltransferase [Acidimicrobiales bacterium]
MNGQGVPDGAGSPAEVDDGDRMYLARVRAEIDEEVRRRRAAGDLAGQTESELEELFLRHAPLGSTRQELHEVLRLVDASAFIDPVVPVESSRPGGAVVKKGVRTLNFWYLRFITHQVSKFATASSRALHILDQQLCDLSTKVEALEVPPSVVVDVGWAHRTDSWWVPGVVTELEGGRRRVLHAACGDGWLVHLLAATNVDGYGVDPRPGRVAGQELGELDLREEPVLGHLEAVEPGALGGVVLCGLMEGSGHGERRRLLEKAAMALAPGGVLVVHSLSPSGWDEADAPPEADIVQARPYRPGTWPYLLGEVGMSVAVTPGPDGRDYLVVGRREAGPSQSR